jgi:hypothetical protein
LRAPNAVPTPPLVLLSAIASLASLAGCGAPGVHFTTKLADGFAPAHPTVSVLGVYKDGQMNSDAWDTVAPRVSRALGASRCVAAYSEPLLSTSGVLSSAIDDYSRANGPTDELLAQLAPAAKGELVLVMTIAGKLPVKQTGSPLGGGGAPQPSLGGGSRGGGMGGPGGGGRGGRMRGPAAGEADTNELDVSASLFSIAQGRSVALYGMQYSGDSVDDAIAQFANQLARSLPGAQCAGWDWDAKIDPDRIRQSIDH